VVKARAIFLRLTRHSPITQAFRYFLLGTGETGLLVHEILLNHLKHKPENERPRLHLISR
jgi:hypothetical protein